MAAIELENLHKHFGDVAALRGVDLAVEDGEIFGFLGPNGAGKSTTIDILLDFVRPTDGTARVLGYDAREESTTIRHRSGVLPEDFGVYKRLTGRQHVSFAAESKGIDAEPISVLDRVGIAEAADRKAGDYSKGMRQRLGLAMSLVGEPDLLILDEPSTGLDPNGAREMREIVREERDRGATVFFSSHILGQVEAVCDRVGILREGELVAVDSVAGLREATSAGATLRVSVDEASEAVATAAREVAGVESVAVEGQTLIVTCDDDAKTDVLAAIEEAGATVSDFTTEEASLDELFAAYTQEDPTAEPIPAGDPDDEEDT